MRAQRCYVICSTERMFDGGQAGADSGGDIAGKGIDSTSKVSFYGCILGFFPFLVWPAIVARALLTHCAAAKSGR